MPGLGCLTLYVAADGGNGLTWCRDGGEAIFDTSGAGFANFGGFFASVAGRLCSL